MKRRPIQRKNHRPEQVILSNAQIAAQFMTLADTITMMVIVAPRSMQHGALPKIVGKGKKPRIVFYLTPEKVEYNKRIAEEVASKAPAMPWIKGPIEIDVDFFLPRPKKLKNAFPGPIPQWAFKGPDWDNLCKGTQDALGKAGFWGDDGQIWQGTARKWYHEIDLFPRIEMTIRFYTATKYHPE